MSLHLTQEQKFCDCGRRSNAITHSTHWFFPGCPITGGSLLFQQQVRRKERQGKICKTLLIEEKGTYVQVFFKPEKLRHIYTYHKIYRKLKLSLAWSLPDLFLVPLETAVQALTTRRSPKEHDLSAGISFKQSSSLSSGNWISISLGYRVVAGEKRPTKTWRPRKDAVRLSTG